MESGVEEKSGGSSIENSKKQRSLDLQTLYKSGDIKKGKLSAGESDVDVVKKKKKKKRKSIKEVSLDKAEPSGKKSRSSKDEDHVNGDNVGQAELQLSSSKLEKRSDFSNRLSGFSLSLDINGNVIPRRPRGFVGRSKFGNGRPSQLSKGQTFVIGNGMIKGEPDKIEADQLPKKCAFSGGEAKSDEQSSKLPSHSADNGVTVKVKRKISADDSREKKKDKVNSAEEDGHVAVNNGEASSRKHRSTRNKRKDSSSRSRNSVKNGVPSGDNFGSFRQDAPNDDDRENLEQNAAMIMSLRFDPSFTRFSSKSRSAASQSAERLSSLPTSGQDFVSREGNSLTGSESVSVDTASRVLRPRHKLKERGISRKRRHFYEVLATDLDPYWVLNRRIKVFWPLDESWYYGLLKDYNPESKLHHVKYDDRDEEWINLEDERFKLLLFPGEVPGKREVGESANATKSIDERQLDLVVDDASHPGNCLDSEPIISWLARSSRRVKSSPARPLKKQKTLQLSTPVVSSLLHVKTEGSDWNFGSSNCCIGRTDNDLLFPEKLIDHSKAENSFVGSHSSPNDGKPVVYVRRRFRKKMDGLPVHEADRAYLADIAADSVAPFVDELQNHKSSVMCIPGPESEKFLSAIDDEGVLRLHMPLLEAKQFRLDIFLPVLPLLLLEAEQSWFCRTVLLLQHGAIMIRWPTFFLEMLFVDNVVGLRFLLFECCLNHAVALIFFVLTLFNQADEEWRYESLQLPVTSVRFRLSSIQDFRKQQSFAFSCFSKLKNSKWLYLDSKLQKRSLLARQLPLSECSYENIKSLDCRSEQLQFNAHADPCKKYLPGCLPKGTSTECCSARLTSSTLSSAMKLGRVPPFALSFAAAPTFFICLHLRILMERNFACVSLQDYSSINACQPVKNDGSRVKCSEIADDIAEISFAAASSAGESPFAERQLGSLACEQQLGSERVSLKSSQNCQLDVSRSSFIAKHSELDTSDVTVMSKDLASDDQVLDQFDESQGRRHSKNLSQSLSNARCRSGLVGMSVVIPSFDQVEGLSDGKEIIMAEASHLTLNTGDDLISSTNHNVTSDVVQIPKITGMGGRMVQSPNPSGPGGLLHRNGNNSSSSPFGEISPAWVDGKANFTGGGFGNGPKRPRTQVQYTLPYGGYDLSSMHKNHSPRTLPYKRIRRASEKKNAGSCGGSQRNIELLACDANVLVTLGGVKGWREFGARIVLEIEGHNEWRIAVKFSGVTKYSYKVHNVLQPGSTNRFTHAMMWKGGKDWVLEFPDRSQWMLFKELHEECYNRNIRAASVKNIPIPGVRLIEEIEDYASEVPFIRSSPKYYRQAESDVEMAMDPSRILYDMDSEDEQWLSKNHFSCSGESKHEAISDEFFEKAMDMFEKVAYARQCDHFAPDELEELMVGAGSMEVKSIYEHWQNKRQKNGMPLIRHLQPPLWERYQQQLKEWEQAMSNANLGFAGVSKEKTASMEKPPMYAFCLKPRGLEVPNKGSKQRSQRKISVSGHNHVVSRDQDGLHPYGRRSNGYSHGDEMVMYPSHEYSDGSPMLHASPGVFSPREASGFGYFSLNSDVSEWNHQPKFYRNKPKKIGSFHSHSNPHLVASYDQRTVVKRNGVHRWNMSLPEWSNQKHYHPEGSRGPAIEQFDNSDLHEFRLRDASGAAQHALNMAKLKREKAQRLLYRADLAIHKAVVALMTAEAIKAAAESSNVDG